MSLKQSIITGLLATFFGVPIANAGLLSYSDRSIFESQGAISEQYGFEDFGAYPAYPGNPWYTHGVTYSSQQNVVFFGALGGKPPAVSHVLTSNYWLSIAGDIDTNLNYHMLGFDLAVLFATVTPGNVVLSIFTDQARYTVGNLGLPDISVGQKFFGYVSTGTERITGFSLTSDTWGTGPTLDNVTLGGAANIVPEPNTGWLLLAGIMIWLRQKHLPGNFVHKP